MKNNHNEPNASGNAWDTSPGNASENTEERSPMQYDGEMPLHVPSSSPEYPRNLWCKHYDACLDTAVARDWHSFSCEACGNRFKGLKKVYDVEQSEPIAHKDYPIPESIPGLPEEVRLAEAVIATEDAFRSVRGGTSKPFTRLPSEEGVKRYRNVAKRECSGCVMYTVRVKTPEGVKSAGLFSTESAADRASPDILRDLLTRGCPSKGSRKVFSTF